ncbi:unnamed protein product [Paramecium pentaurelia]|uniref:Uncharacterized protein n=1 Tax=Paramecium pentaurelia TaxID=43138 RepID=A0A8S1VGS0_9CILI|nr:unnamed protein product [Paramecium pentaurelia]
MISKVSLSHIVKNFCQRFHTLLSKLFGSYEIYFRKSDFIFVLPIYTTLLQDFKVITRNSSISVYLNGFHKQETIFISEKLLKITILNFHVFWISAFIIKSNKLQVVLAENFEEILVMFLQVHNIFLLEFSQQQSQKMIFFTLILIVQSFLWKYEDYTLYLTNGKYLEYPMNTLFNILHNIITIYPLKHYSHLSLQIQHHTKINLYRFVFHQEKTHIYILYKKQISYFIISQNYTLEQTYPFYLQKEAEADNFQVYYDYQAYSQCDLLLINFYPKNGRIATNEYLGCQNNILFEYQYTIFIINNKIDLVFLDNEFELIQSQMYLTLYQQYHDLYWLYCN